MDSDIENLRHPPPYDPRGFRWAIVLCVAFWAGVIVSVVRCSHG